MVGEEWNMRLKIVIDTYPNLKIVVPGHGGFGGMELLEHTKELVRSNK